MNRFRPCRPVLRINSCRPARSAGPPAGPPASRASIKFLSEAFAVWCDQKSRLAGARATGLLDDESHDALAEAYARTRELIGALLARAEAQRAADRNREGERTREPGSAQPRQEPRVACETAIDFGGASDDLAAPGRRACPAC